MSIPQFGSPAGMPPTQPIAPPAFSAPAMPPAAGPVPSFRTAPVAAQGPGLGSQLATMIPALLMGLKDPLSMGAAMRGIQKARDRAMAQRETAQENADRKARERVDFYGRMLENAAQFDDEIEFTDWKRAIAPVAEYHGIPVEAVTFNAGKGAAKERRVVQDAIDQAIKRHGAEVLNRDDISVQLPDGRSMSMATARQLIGGEVTAAGARVPVKVQPTAAARTRVIDRTLPDGSTVREIVPDEPGQTFTTAGPSSPVVPNTDFARSVDTYMREKGKTYADRTIADEAAVRKALGQADDRPPSPRPSGPTDAQQFTMTERLAGTWARANAPVREMDRQMRIMDAGMKRFRSGDTNGGSQAVLVTFQKILDPQSVVRESEYARTMAGQSLLNRIEGYATRLAAGGTTLTDAEMAAMVETARDMMADMSNWSAGTRGRIQRSAEQYGIDPALVFDDVLTGGGAAVPSRVDPRSLELPPSRRGGAGPVGTPAAAETPEQRGARILRELTK